MTSCLRVLRVCVVLGANATAIATAIVAWAPATARAQQAVASVSPNDDRRIADSLLMRLATVHVTQVSRKRAIQAAAASANVVVQYRANLIEAYDDPVTIQMTDAPLGLILEKVLLGTPLHVVLDGTTQLAIVKRPTSDAQQGSGVVVGTVLDGRTNEPIGGVTIGPKEPSKGILPVASRLRDGRFALTLPSGTHVLAAHRLGYLSQDQRVTVVAGDTVHVQFQLSAVPSILQGVVTTGAGDRAKLEVGNAISTINADSVVQTTPIRNLADLLNGRAAGLDVLPSGGTAGAGSKIRIRGESSLMASEDPVVIVDGVRFDAQYTRSRTGNASQVPAINMAMSYVPASSRLDDIDPESIESIDVLKGPAASALYGSDAANGVIVIKTKHGHAGPTRWSVMGESGLSSMAATYPETYFGWGKVYGDLPSSTTCALANVAALTCTQDSVTHFNPINHDDTSPFTTGHDGQLNGQVSGGNDRQQYFVGATYEDNQGFLRFPPSLRAATLKQLNGNAIPEWADHPNELNATSATTTLSSQIGNHDVSLSATGRRQYHRDISQGATGFIRTAATSGLGYRDTVTQGWGSSTPAESFLTLAEEQLTRGYGSLSGNVRPTSLFTIHATGGVDYSSNDQQGFLAQNYVLPGNASRRQHVVLSNLLTTGDLNATFELPVAAALTLRTTGGTQYTSASTTQLTGFSSGLPAGSDILDGATTNQSTDFSNQQVTTGWYLQETASLNERLFLTAAVRADASSAFGGVSRTVSYPKWNGSWLISEEPFFPKMPGLNSLRLRIGYGHAGANPSFDSKFRTYNLVSGYANGATVTTIDIRSVGNSEVLPERSVETEGGFDLGLMEDRVTMGFTIADKVTRNALMSRALPPSFGSNAYQVENLGEITNRNVELEATVRPLVARALSWNATFVLSQTKNRLVSLGTAQPTAGIINSFGAQPRFVPGYPVDGVWTRAIVSYGDANHDGILESNEIRYADSLTYAGHPSPTHTLGWQNNLSLWSGIVSVGANFTYTGDALQYNSIQATMCQSRLCQGAVDQTAPLAMQAEALSAALSSWAYLEHVSAFRFEELSATWNMPASAARLLRSQRASLSLMGRNLKFWSHYRGADPEVNTSNAGGDAVVDGGGIVQPRSWSVRVNLGY